jgi:hypothetical protein
VCLDDTTTTGGTGGNRTGGTGAVCPECGEPVPPTAPRPADEPVPVWSHLDGEPLCPVIGPHGYRPGHPRYTAAPPPDTD